MLPRMLCFFASDIHGMEDRYAKLFAAVEGERPDAVFLGGDLLPHGFRVGAAGGEEFISTVVEAGLEKLRRNLRDAYPRVFLILGNDDPRSFEESILEKDRQGLWTYLHERRSRLGDRLVMGYACIPPTPFRLKDWERYDVSRFVDPGAVPPEEGVRSVDVDERDVRNGTIQADLERLAGSDDLSDAIVLFHTPPYDTCLDRAALDGKQVDYVPLDVHVGSIAVRRFIEARQPRVTLHGHVHESARLTGRWLETAGRTVMLGAAHDGPELALVRFDPGRPEDATREIV